MTASTCPMCEMNDILTLEGYFECVTCGHEWPLEEAPEGDRVVKDAYGNVPPMGTSSR